MNQPKSIAKIGFIGLGRMGLPMAGRLREAGYEVHGINRSPEKERAFAAKGGIVAASLARLAGEMDVVITCLPMPSDVEDVYLGAEGLLAAARHGLIAIDCSTVAPELSRRLYREAADRGVDFIDAPVSGGTTGAADGTLSIMCGGRKTTFERIEGILNAMGKQIYYAGEPGSGAAIKLVNQLMVGIHTQAVAEAFSLAERFGLDPDLLYSVLSRSFAQSRMLERHYTQFMAPGTYEPGFAAKLLLKDLNLAAEAASASGASLPAGARVLALLRRAAANGRGDMDMAGMAVYQRERDAAGTAALKHFAVFLPMRDAEKSVRHREAHLAFLHGRRDAGMLLANGRFVDGAGGLVIYRAESVEEVESWVKRDPYIIEGARSYEIHEWDIVLADG